MAFLAGARADLVLCTSADGHFEIEQAAHGICTGPGPATETAGHCGLCVDVPLGTGPAVRALGSHFLPDSPALRVAISLSAGALSSGVHASLHVLLRPLSGNAGTRVLRI